MPRYLYTGPNSAVTLKVSDGKGSFKDQDVVFWKDQEVDLPTGHEMVAVLVEQGHLTLVPAVVDEPKATAEAKSKVLAK